jgi:ABC-type transport system involved in cytochrome bd biosynthesis fused ATPase/permease subunit
MNKSYLLQFKDVYFSYGEEKILNKCSFQAHQNDHIVLKGTSGSGKSTIMKLILGFLKPDTGIINFSNNEQDHSTDIRAFTSCLPQELNVGEGTLAEVLDYPFRFAVNKVNKPDKKNN